MIDSLKRAAQAIQVLRLPSLIIGLISLALLAVKILLFTSDQGDRYIIPSLVGLFWGIGTYSFIVTFRDVPDRQNAVPGFFGKLKHTITRFWYGLISIIFLGATVAIFGITIRMVLIWWRDHG